MPLKTSYWEVGPHTYGGCDEQLPKLNAENTRASAIKLLINQESRLNFSYFIYFIFNWDSIGQRSAHSAPLTEQLQAHPQQPLKGSHVHCQGIFTAGNFHVPSAVLFCLQSCSGTARVWEC